MLQIRPFSRPDQKEKKRPRFCVDRFAQTVKFFRHRQPFALFELHYRNAKPSAPVVTPCQLSPVCDRACSAFSNLLFFSFNFLSFPYTRVNNLQALQMCTSTEGCHFVLVIGQGLVFPEIEFICTIACCFRSIQ